MEIVYWSDYACPYCYIGETHMKTALQELSLTDKVKIEMKAFELDPFASKEYTGTTVDRFARKYGLSTEAAASASKIFRLWDGEQDWTSAMPKPGTRTRAMPTA